MICGGVEYKLSLLSYPRSGSNWLSYCIECLSEMQIGGSLTGFLSIGNKITKSHGNTKSWWKDFILCKDSLILMVRNYKECVVRNCDGDLAKVFSDLQGGLPLKTGIEKTDYISILKLFEYTKEKKHLIYYEDLVQNPYQELSRLVKFLEQFGGNKGNITSFMKQYEQHRKTSLELYGKKIDKPRTNGTRNELLFHSKKLTKETKLKIDDHLIKRFPNIYNKYLKRYGENDT